MATDATFERISEVRTHNNADSLEIAIVSRFPCIVRKGEFKAGDIVFYIRDDAKLLGFDELKAREDRDKKAQQDGSFVTQDCFSSTWMWQDNLLKYLGGGGRVKTCKLRGEVSMGILVKPRDLFCGTWGTDVTDANIDEINANIRNPETGQAYLEKNFGVTHWIAPTLNFGNLNVKYAGLPCSLAKTDEENYENLPECDLHLGSLALVTKKLDGTSTTITCYPDDRGYDISSRSQTFNIKSMIENNQENVYTRYTQEAVKAGLWYAKKYNTTIAIRGETCCHAVQASSYNKDCQLDGFYVYSCEFPDLEDYYDKHGLYGTDHHFVKIVNEMNSNGFNVKTVPVLGEETVTRELLKKYNDIPWDWGEGVVLNIKVDRNNTSSIVWHYKSKSREYLMKMK